MDSSQTINVRLTADGKQLQATMASGAEATLGIGKAGKDAGAQAAAGLNQAADSATAFGATAKQAGAQAASGFDQASGSARNFADTARSTSSQASASIGSVGDSIGTVKSLFLGLIGAVTFAGAISEAKDYADAYTNISAKIQLTTASEIQRATVLSGLLKTAQDTGTAIENDTKLYQRMYQALESAGESQTTAQTRALALTDEISKILITSGATANESKLAIQDLSHGLAEGTIQWRQLSQVMREAPQLAKTLADGLGVTVGELKSLAGQGKITTEAFTDALLSEAGKVSATFAQVPQTFARAIQQLENSITVYVGQASQASRASALIKQGIVGIGDNIGTVATGIEVLGGVIALNLGSKALSYVGGLVQQLGAIAAPEQAAAAAALKTAQASETAAAASVVREKALIQQLETMNAALAAEAKLAEVDLFSGGTAENAAAARQRMNAALGQQIAVSDAAIAADARLAVAERDLALATAQVGLAAEASVAELTIAQEAMNVLAAAGKGALALIGGLPGLALAGGAALLYLATQSDAASEATDKLNASTAQLNAESDGAISRLLHFGDAAKQVQSSALDLATANLKNAEATLQNRTALDHFIFDMPSDGETIEALRGRVVSLTKALQDNKAAVDRATVSHDLEAISTTLIKVFTDQSNSVRQLGLNTDAATDAARKMSDSEREAAETVGKTNVQLAQRKEAQDLANIAVFASVPGYDKMRQAILAADDQLIKDASAHDAAIAANKKHGDSQKELNEALAIYNEIQKQGELAAKDMLTLQQQLDKELGDVGSAALEKYTKNVIELAAEWVKEQEKANSNGLKVSIEQQTAYAHAIDTARLVLEHSIEADRQKHDLMAQAENDLINQQALDGVAIQDQAAVTAGLNAYDERLKTHFDFYGRYVQDESDLREALNAQLPLYVQARQAVNDISAAQRQNQATTQEWISTASNGLNSFGSTIASFATGGIKKFADFKTAVISDLQQFGAAIIEQILKLTVFNGVINSLFGLSGSSALPTGLGNGLLGQLAGGGGVNAGSLLQNGQSLLSGGNNLLGLFGGSSGSTSALDAAVNVPAYGGFDFAGTAGGTDFGAGFNTATAGTGTAGAGSGVGTFGTVASIAGGVLAGLNEFKAAGGGIGGIAGGAAYGVGTYLGGTALAAGLGAIGGGVGAAGSAAFGALGALGPVGWVALAAVLVDKISGGKLFGTSNQTYQTKSQVLVGPDNTVTAAAEEDQKRQKALFGGTQYSVKTIDPSQDAKDAATQLSDTFSAAFKAGEAAFGLSAAQSITGTWSTVTQYNDKGAATATQTISNVLGKVYTESVQDFASRINSENEILLADQGGAAGEATKFAEQYRATAATLADAAAVAYQAELDIHNGNALLGSNATFDATVALVQQLNQSGETLSATYSRLSAETQAVVAGARLLGTTINKSGADLVKFADDFVQSAGGADAANKLWNDFYANFFSDTERAKAALDTARAASNAALGAIGEDPTESLAKFRTDFEAALPNLSATQLTTWLQAAEILAAATKAQDDYNSAVGQAGDAATQSADQLKTVQDILAGNAATLNDANLTDAQKAVEQINKSYADQKTQLLANAATIDQLNQLDAERTQALAAQAAIEQKAYTDFEATLGDTLSGLTTTNDAYIAAVLDAQKTQAQQIAQAQQLAIAAGKAGASEQDLATIHDISATKIAQAMATLQASAQSLANTLYGTDVDKLNKQLTALQQRTSDLAQIGIVDTGGFQQEAALQKQIADAQAQADKASRAEQATQLAQMVAEIALGQQESFADVAKSLGFSLDQLGTDLGVSDVNAYLQKQEDLASTELGIKSAADLTNVLLQRIIDIAQQGAFLTPGLIAGGADAASIVATAGETALPLPLRATLPHNSVPTGAATAVRVAPSDNLATVHDAKTYDLLQAKLDKVAGLLQTILDSQNANSAAEIAAAQGELARADALYRAQANRRGNGMPA